MPRLASTRLPRDPVRPVGARVAGPRPAILVLAILGVLAPLTPAHAQQRLPTSRMTCTDAKAIVKRDGDVTLGTSGGRPERLVADRSYCELSEIAELRFVPTRDNPQCPVGYRCKAPEFEDWNWR